MAVNGLRNEADSSVSDDAGAAVEALYMLNLVRDRELVEESITREFETLSYSGKIGEPFIQLPRHVASLPYIIDTLDTGLYPRAGAEHPLGRKYPKTAEYYEWWDREGGGMEMYEDDDIGNLELGQKDDSWPVHARLAIYNPDCEEEPLLHFLGMDFSKEISGREERTQMSAIANAKREYETQHPDFTMMPLNASGFAMVSLMRRIKGQSSPVTWGALRDASLPAVLNTGRKPPQDPLAKALYQPSYWVPNIDTDPRWEGGQLRFGSGENGFAAPHIGVGLSAGLRFES
jgi:hypothetical protein